MAPQQQPPIQYAASPRGAAYPGQSGQGGNGYGNGYGNAGGGTGGRGKKRWWTIPKVVVAGVIAVLLAGAGGGAIGYGIGDGNASHHGFANGQFKGGRYHSYPGGGSGPGSQVTPAPGSNNNP
ncbi:MAG: hypothetical protein WBX27_19475 [Specibacter sp.]